MNIRKRLSGVIMLACVVYIVKKKVSAGHEYSRSNSCRFSFSSDRFMSRINLPNWPGTISIVLRTQSCF